ncbi:MAG: hypothetical protein JRN68_05765 [Nitrososphaerota archaeon]|jgi:hypothetical protein|nr:hypothetical protein [Nitrososphaerota archaeon]
MESEGNGGESTTRNLDDVLRSAEDWYIYLRKKHDGETIAWTVAMGVIAWLAALLILALSSFTLLHVFFASYLLEGITVITILAVAVSLLTYFIRRRRAFPFVELRNLIDKMKNASEISSYDYLKLVDQMHDVLLAVKKGKLDSAQGDGIVAFIVVALFGFNIGLGLLAGIIVYLYFRYEAIREYDNETRRYLEAKREFIEGL